ncbi:hypothetical protein GA830_12165 [Mesorhizobium sp. NBSH29]|uniref:head-tail connector protein n=1 Tax=Mesorhizobium sp. NBSH29 TaxID=2654249 RepID=UPI0018967496|nr:head-tail connector protein [Mesorhizobium sp. NBSH29]QPC87412.1 hypothetical protein GA830_12165 [Mesorhizobium sp. NBSH29]
MHRPVLVTAPASMPVTLDEAKAQLRVDSADDSTLIEGMIQAATDHLDGWTGILGRCLVEQTWKQDFDGFSSCLPLPLGPVMSVTSVEYTDTNGAPATVDPGAYSVKTDAGGQSRIEFKGVSVSGPVSVTYIAGYESVPPALKTAILLLVGHWYAHREAVTGDSAIVLPMAVDALIAPFRRVGV